jgi:hypothetical protein
LSKDEILNYTIERPDYLKQYEFILQIQYFKSEKKFAEIIYALITRIRKVDSLKDKMQN